MTIATPSSSPLEMGKNMTKRGEKSPWWLKDRVGLSVFQNWTFWTFSKGQEKSLLAALAAAQSALAHCQRGQALYHWGEARGRPLAGAECPP